MTIDVTQDVKDYDGKPVIAPGDTDPLTLRAVFTSALNMMEQGEQIGAETKSKMYALTQKLFATKVVSLTVDEATLIKERVGKGYGPLIYGRVCDALDKKSD